MWVNKWRCPHSRCNAIITAATVFECYSCLLMLCTASLSLFNLFLFSFFYYLWSDLYALHTKWLRTAEVQPSGILPQGSMSDTKSLGKKLVTCKLVTPYWKLWTTPLIFSEIFFWFSIWYHLGNCGLGKKESFPGVSVSFLLFSFPLLPTSLPLGSSRGADGLASPWQPSVSLSLWFVIQSKTGC